MQLVPVQTAAAPRVVSSGGPHACMWAAAPCGGGGPITVHPSFKWHTTPQGKLRVRGGRYIYYFN